MEQDLAELAAEAELEDLRIRKEAEAIMVARGSPGLGPAAYKEASGRQALVALRS